MFATLGWVLGGWYVAWAIGFFWLAFGTNGVRKEAGPTILFCGLLSLCWLPCFLVAVYLDWAIARQCCRERAQKEN